MDCLVDFISLNNVTVISKMLEENQVHWRCFAFAGVWISHYKIKSQLVVKYLNMSKFIWFYSLWSGTT